MSLETIPYTEAYEFDRLLVDASTTPDRVAAEDLPAFLGRVAVHGAGAAPYLRSGKYLSSDDIEQLESFYALLRSHYGIPEDKPVFPKKEETPVVAPLNLESEVQRAA